jgi:hypothetical protein
LSAEIHKRNETNWDIEQLGTETGDTITGAESPSSLNDESGSSSLLMEDPAIDVADLLPRRPFMAAANVAVSAKSAIEGFSWVVLTFLLFRLKRWRMALKIDMAGMS